MTAEAAIIVGDMRATLADMPADSVDAVVTDCPYELSFMGKKWDGTGISFDPATWRAAWRVLKPGGHLLAFGGTRTVHRIACAIEDAGFEIRDQIAWMYGTGFPKSLDVSKAIDKAAGAERAVVGVDLEWVRRTGHGTSPGGIGLTQAAFGSAAGPNAGKITAPATEAAQQWQGWGTALKPSYEPVIVARKPLAGTVAANVQEYGTGALNVDGCRVGTDDDTSRQSNEGTNGDGWGMGQREHVNGGHAAGRWPANVILDPAAARLLDLQAGDDVSRFFYVAKPDRRERDIGCESLPAKTGAELTDRQPDTAGLQNPRAGAGRTSGGRNTHATVKPVDLMRYLCRLVCPPGGTVLDPFAGSGTTGIAAHLEGFGFIGIELRAEAAQIARLRLSATQRGELYVDKKTDKTEHRQATDNRQQGLFV